MNKKYLGIIIVAIVVLVAAVAACYIFVFNTGDTTELNAAFISGTFTGNVTENPINDSVPNHQYQASYTDNQNGISYNMSTLKNGTFLIDLMQLQGLPAPEHRHLGDNDWNIYYSQAAPTSQLTNNSSNVTKMNVYICEAEKDNQTFLIYVVSNSSNVQCDGSLYCPLYKDYVEPLLSSATLKTNPSAPNGAQVLNLTDTQYNQLVEQINQAKGTN